MLMPKPQRRLRPKPQRKCKDCGVEVGGGKSVCAACQKEKAKARYRSLHPHAWRHESRVCSVCKTPFNPVCLSQVSCSKKCQNAKNRPRYKGRASERAKAYNAKNAHEIAAKLKVRRKEPGVCVYRNWDSATRRSGYTGTLEEWAEHRERAAIKVIPSAAEPKTPKPRSPTYGMTEAEQFRYWYRSDPAFGLWERQRNQFKKWFKGERRTNTLARTVGYSRDQLLKHIEAQFTDGMGWHNAGQWHIDHIIPKNLFNPANAQHVVKCWSLDNLRPLWAADNHRRPKDGSDVLHMAVRL